MTRRAPAHHLGPRIREIRAYVEANPGLSACRIAADFAGRSGAAPRTTLAAIARAVAGGWIQRGDGERPGLFPVPSP